MTVAQIINIAKISQYLAQVDVANGALYGQRVTPLTPKILFTERTAVEWLYNLDPTNSSLVQTANYLYSLCRGYNLKAQSVTGGGGSVSPVTPSGSPSPLQFNVAASGTTFISGQSSAVLTSFIGFNLLFARGGIPQSTLNSESSYYTWDKVTGTLTVSPDAVFGELFQIYPI